MIAQLKILLFRYAFKDIFSYGIKKGKQQPPIYKLVNTIRQAIHFRDLPDGNPAEGRVSPHLHFQGKFKRSLSTS